jgi:hypothetical protein
MSSSLIARRLILSQSAKTTKEMSKAKTAQKVNGPTGELPINIQRTREKKNLLELVTSKMLLILEEEISTKVKQEIGTKSKPTRNTRQTSQGKMPK